MQLDLSDPERAVLITALRALVERDPHQTQTAKAILERLDPQKPQALPDNASTG
jgi:hypothetical protein